MQLLSAETNECLVKSFLTAPGSALENVCVEDGLYITLLLLALPVNVCA